METKTVATRMVALLLLIPQGINRVEVRCFTGRIKAKKDAHGGGKKKTTHDGGYRDQGGPAGQAREGIGDGDAEPNADDASNDAQHDRFDKKLHQDIAPHCSDGHADANFPRSLGY